MENYLHTITLNNVKFGLTKDLIHKTDNIVEIELTWETFKEFVKNSKINCDDSRHIVIGNNCILCEKNWNVFQKIIFKFEKLFAGFDAYGHIYVVYMGKEYFGEPIRFSTILGSKFHLQMKLFPIKNKLNGFGRDH